MAVFKFAQNCVAASKASAAWLLIGVALLMSREVPAYADNAQYFYDAGGRLVGVIDPVAGSAKYDYDQAGNITAIARTSVASLGIVQFFPIRGTSGTTVTVSGTGFGTTANTTVKFNGVSASPSAVTQTSITVAVPASATTGALSVTVSGTTVSSGTFTVASAPVAPSITNFSPATQVPGSSITVTGANFDTANGKAFINNQAALITAATITSLTVTVPPAVSSGKIVVQAATGTATSSADLAIPPPPLTVSNVFAKARSPVNGTPTSLALPASNAGGSLLLFDPTFGNRVSVYTDFGSSMSCPYLTTTLINPQGGNEDSINNVCYDRHWYVTPYLIAGTHSLEVLPKNVASTVSFTLFDVPPDVSVALPKTGAATPMSIGTPGQQGSFSFTGAEGDKISLRIDSTGMSTCINWTLYNPDGTTLYGPDERCQDANWANQGPIILPQTSCAPAPCSPSYVIKVEPSLTNGPAGNTLTAGTGTVTANLFAVPANDIAGTITLNGAETPITLAIPGEHASIQFQGTAGQQVTIGVNKSTNEMRNWVTYWILDPDKQQLGPTKSDDFVLNGVWFNDGPIVLNKTSTAAKPYQAIIAPNLSSGADAGELAAGTGTLSAFGYLNNPPVVSNSLTIGGGTKSVTLSTPGQQGAFTFSGTTGQKVKVQLTPLANYCSYFTISSGLVSSPTSLCNNPYTSPTLTLPSSGPFTISIIPNLFAGVPNQGTGTLSASVTNVP